MSLPRPQTPPQTRTMPFAAQPCRCCARHVPVCHETEGHHRLPQTFQRALWGAVRDRELAFLCRDGHRAVHLWLTAKLTEQPPIHLNAYLRGVAVDGLARITAAYDAAGRPLPTDGRGE